MITLRELADHLHESAERAPGMIHDIVAVVAKSAEERARSYIGTPQPASAGFPAWEPLHDSTLYGFFHWRGRWIEGKIDQGFAPPDNPLLRRGNLRDSIASTAEENVGIVGSTSKIGLYQELGTPNADYPIEARSFLGRAVAESEPEIREQSGMLAIELLVPPSARP